MELFYSYIPDYELFNLRRNATETKLLDISSFFSRKVPTFQ